MKKKLKKILMTRNITTIMKNDFVADIAEIKTDIKWIKEKIAEEHVCHRAADLSSVCSRTKTNFKLIIAVLTAFLSIQLPIVFKLFK